MKVKVYLLLSLAVVLVNLCVPTDAVHIIKGEEDLKGKGKVCSQLESCIDCESCCNEVSDSDSGSSEEDNQETCLDSCLAACTSECPIPQGNCADCEACCASACGSNTECQTSCKASCKCSSSSICPSVCPGFDKCEDCGDCCKLAYSEDSGTAQDQCVDSCIQGSVNECKFPVCADYDSCDDCLDCCAATVCNGVPDPVECDDLTFCVESCVNQYSVVPSNPAPCDPFACFYLGSCSRCTDCCSDYCSATGDQYCHDDCVFNCFFSTTEISSFECTPNNCAAFEDSVNCQACCLGLCYDDDTSCINSCMDACPIP